MNFALLIGLLIASGVLMLIERAGVPTTLELSFKGDIKRETQWLAQYGQFVCTAAAAALIWFLDPIHKMRAPQLICAVLATSISAFILKRLIGRVRPNRESERQFLGPTLRHANWRESFPSSHSACAVALTVTLIQYYPLGAGVFWTFALITAALRYVMQAHWPSDVVGGIALGYGMSFLMLHLTAPYF